jgi:hypothetical protein
MSQQLTLIHHCWDVAIATHFPANFMYLPCARLAIGDVAGNELLTTAPGNERGAAKARR